MNLNNQNQVRQEQQHLQMLYDKLQQAHQQKYKIMETQECFANICPALQDADNNIAQAQQDYENYLHSPKTIPTHCTFINGYKRRRLHCTNISNNTNNINNINTFNNHNVKIMLTILLFIAYCGVMTIPIYGYYWHSICDFKGHLDKTQFIIITVIFTFVFSYFFYLLFCHLH